MEKVKQYVGGCEELLLEEKVDRRRYKGDREARCSNQHLFLKNKKWHMKDILRIMPSKRLFGFKC